MGHFKSVDLNSWGVSDAKAPELRQRRGHAPPSVSSQVVRPARPARSYVQRLTEYAQPYVKSQLSPKVLKALRGRTGPKGLPGHPGATGPAGAAGKEGAAGKNATIPAPTWQPLALENGWLQYTSEDFGAPRYAKDSEGFVHLSGAIEGLSKTSILFATLPAGFRPTAENVWLRAASAGRLSAPDRRCLGGGGGLGGDSCRLSRCAWPGEADPSCYGAVTVQEPSAAATGPALKYSAKPNLSLPFSRLELSDWLKVALTNSAA